ncbi:hypothetical protein NUW58_g5635 [Xylaria curta]|uniref:Uncharacterized protein n=1 Tax=Xylaria curta TaxID=42375 RepID=A0ACC1P2W7_9PEZI|nr:hypothetical protein NUW58_g5635 [Xylaria curta]
MLFKVAALAALSASVKEASHGLAAAAQHVAACMILCSFEILLPSENSGEWILYVRAAMEVIQRAQLGNQSDYGDNVGLVDWVYYHNSLSRFTLSHWRHRYLAVGSTDTGTGPVTQIAHLLANLSAQAPLPQSRTHTILNTLSEICDVLLDPSDPRSQDVAYRNRLKALEWKVDNFPTWSSTTAVSDKPGEELEFTLQLYKTATRIYLTRASQNPLEPMANLDSSIDWAYTGALQHGNCRHFFPLLIIACEARTDEQRAAVLNLINRTEKKGYVRSMMAFRSQVQSFWKQYDLHADSDLILNYLGLMKAVISSNTALPSYA